MEKLIADNRKATFDYFIEDKYEAGIVLVGSEVKSLRAGKANLKDSYVTIKNGEVFLLNAHISTYEKSSFEKVDERRTRKLLLNKTEINKLSKKLFIKGYTIVPLKMYFKDNLAKVQIAIAKGKELYNKKESLKEKDIKRESDRELKRFKIK